MKTKLTRLSSIMFAFALALVMLGGSAVAQIVSNNSSTSTGSPTRTDRSIEYHGGPVLYDSQVVFFILYGNWSTNTDQILILADFMSNLGSSPYFKINQGYPNSVGQAPSGDLAFGGVASDAYSHGATLTEADVADVVANAILTGGVPLDPTSIYVVLTSPDVTVVDTVTQFCKTCCNFHGHSVVVGSDFRYVFVGSPRRCPSVCATQAQSPNSTSEAGSYEADSMASWLAAALSEVVTNPHDDAWYDRNGLENAEKCEGTYGATYTVTNQAGQLARANIKLGTRDYLLQQNWVNGKKGHCAMSYLQ
jgi:hypothetical protein